MATRSLLHLINSQHPDLPVYCLVDYDPDGFAIYRTYKYGSNSLSHEQHTTVPNLRWLGLKSKDILCSTQGMIETSNTGSLVNPDSQLSNPTVDTRVPLTDRDRQRAVGLLGKITDTEESSHEIMCHMREIQLMLMLNMKAEIQTVDQMGDIAAWLDQRLA